MNIKQHTLDALKELYSYTFYDKFTIEVPMNKATNLHIGFTKDGEKYIGKSIKLPTAKEVTIKYIVDKIETDKTFKNFCEHFNTLIHTLNLGAYPASYGVGVFCLGSERLIQVDKDNIESLLNQLGVQFYTEYSDAYYVFRYKISKSKENIERIEKIIA